MGTEPVATSSDPAETSEPTTPAIAMEQSGDQTANVKQFKAEELIFIYSDKTGEEAQQLQRQNSTVEEIQLDGDNGIFWLDPFC